MSIADNDEVTEILDRVKDMAEVNRPLIQEQLGDRPYKHKQPSDAEFLMWWEQKLAENPPVPVQTPTGEVITISPFLLALFLAKNGNEWFSRYKAAVRREQERTDAAIQQYAPQEVA